MTDARTEAPDAQACSVCGDAADWMTVTTVDAADAVCVDACGASRRVAVELVGPVGPGDRLLVHAGVAIEIARTR